MVSLVDTREQIVVGMLQRVDADRRPHRAAGSRGRSLPYFTVVSEEVQVRRVSKQGKHCKLIQLRTERRPRELNRRGSHAEKEVLAGGFSGGHPGADRGRDAATC